MKDYVASFNDVAVFKYSELDKKILAEDEV